MQRLRWLVASRPSKSGELVTAAEDVAADDSGRLAVSSFGLAGFGSKLCQRPTRPHAT